MAVVATNSLGMRLLRIEPGSFLMGNDRALPDELFGPSCFRHGDFDERPVHRVTITQPFEMGECEVTNAQYERFDPAHRELRGRMGFSRDDDEAVVFVSWHEAVAFCRWCGCRLPTESEWEYACRAGTTTPFWTGDSVPASMRKNAGRSWYPDPRRSAGETAAPLHVGRGEPNPWGLHDMHGNVEEWCADWYGPYPAYDQVDPTGPATGDFRVTRGGSHSTELYYLRSANRSGALPEERSWLIGFRVVRSPAPPAGRPARQAPVSLHAVNVRQDTRPAAPCPEPAPRFTGPVRYVRVPGASEGPMYWRHNHDPAICQCPNGDLLAIWYNCIEESGRELCVVASRLRVGSSEWEPASPFWDAPDRNDHCPALWCDGKRLYHFNGMSVAATWGPLEVILRTSEDSGSTWSPARIIVPGHGPRHMPIASVFALRDGTIVLPCDAATEGHGGTALWMSRDGGERWSDAGGTIAGIHASAAELADGRLLAFGRGDEIEGRMAMSVSRDRGKSWECSASPFPPVRSGQRLVLMRLRGSSAPGSDPLLLVSFANAPIDSPEAYRIPDAAGRERAVSGMYSALSFDDGASWPFRRVVSDGAPERTIEAMDGQSCRMGPDRGEADGYLAACQAADGTVHLISSTNHYTFNLAWLVEGRRR